MSECFWNRFRLVAGLPFYFYFLFSIPVCCWSIGKCWRWLGGWVAAENCLFGTSVCWLCWIVRVCGREREGDWGSASCLSIIHEMDNASSYNRLFTDSFFMKTLSTNGSTAGNRPSNYFALLFFFLLVKNVHNSCQVICQRKSQTPVVCLPLICLERLWQSVDRMLNCRPRLLSGCCMLVADYL